MTVSIKKNLGLQTVYQVINLCVPLITAPYLARTLGVSQLGVFSYTSSVVTYFCLFAMLGTVNYGTRAIASVKENEIERSRCFVEIYVLQLLCSFVVLCLYAAFVVFFCKENKMIVIIQSISLISCIFDISWLFWGMEKIQITVFISTLFRIITVVSILLLVKKQNDLWIYTVLILGGTLCGQIVLWLLVPRYINFISVSQINLKQHVKPNLMLFIPLLAMSVFHIMDKTMLGLFSTDEQSGLYYNSDKIINIPLGVLNGIGTVMLPRMTSLYNSGETAKGNHVFVLSSEMVSCFSIAMAMGISAISIEFIPLFFGSGYEKCVLLTAFLSPVLFFKGVSNTIRTQYLIPLKRENVFIWSVVAGASVNLFANYILIPVLGALGAVLGTILAEVISCVLQLFYVKNNINIKSFFVSSLFYFLFGLVMIITVRIAALLPLPMAIKVITEIGVGFSTYWLCCLFFWRFTKNEIASLLIKKAK